MKDCFNFTDARDICIGVGRIVWARELHYDGFHPKFVGRTLSEGWVLPGGERTKDRSIAEAAAEAINSVVNMCLKNQSAELGPNVRIEPLPRQGLSARMRG